MKLPMLVQFLYNKEKKYEKNECDKRKSNLKKKNVVV